MKRTVIFGSAMIWLCCVMGEARAAVPSAFPGVPDSEPATGLAGNEVGDIVFSGRNLWVAAGSYVCKLVGSGEQAADWIRYDYGRVLPNEAPAALCVYGDTIWVSTGYRTSYHGEEIPAGNGLYLSEDGGVSWQHFDTEDLFPDRRGMAYPDNYTTCYDIVFDGRTVWASFTAGFLVKTTDNGNTWEQILPNTDEFDFQDPTHHGQCVIAYNDTLWVGTFGGIMRSVDAGVTWVNYDASAEGISGNFVPALARQVVDGQSIIWAGTKAKNPGESEGVSVTRDQGATWQHVNIPARTVAPLVQDTTAVSAWNFAFGMDLPGETVSDSSVWAATGDALFESSDVGETWRKLNIEDHLSGQAADREILYVAFAEEVLWASTAKGLARSTDYGSSWRILTAPVRTLSMDQEEFVPGIGEDEERIRTYAYQNPFSPSRHNNTTIQYSLSQPGRVTIRIYDFAGVLVAALLENEQREGGANHGEEWDGLNGDGKQVANGTYFYRIETDGGHTAFGKIVVLD